MNEQQQLIADLQAAREIVANNWSSEGLTNADGGLCIVAALNMAIAGQINWAFVAQPKRFTTRRDAACKQLSKHVPPDGWGRTALAHYNDSGITHQDAVNLYDKALADLGGLT